MVASIIIGIVLLLLVFKFEIFHNFGGKISIAAIIVSMASLIVNKFIMPLPILASVTSMALIVAIVIFVFNLIYIVFKTFS